LSTTAEEEPRRRTPKSIAQEEYTTYGKKSLGDKRSYTERLASDAEKAPRNSSKRKGPRYNITKKLSGTYSKIERTVKSKDGKTLIGRGWREHFVELLNRQRR
jgi:hypothetical protein